MLKAQNIIVWLLSKDDITVNTTVSIKVSKYLKKENNGIYDIL